MIHWDVVEAVSEGDIFSYITLVEDIVPRRRNRDLE